MEQRHNSSPTNITVVIISLLVGAIIGYLIGILTGDSPISNSIQGATQNNSEAIGQTNEVPRSAPSENNSSGSVESTLVEGDPDEVAFTIPLDRLSTEQRTGLRLMGIDSEELVITKGTVACAEAEMGSERMLEIQTGSSVTMGEGMTLISCYNAN